MYNQPMSRLDSCMHITFELCMHASESHACARGAWAPCIPFQDNLESNSGLNFNADSETHHP